MKSFTTYRLATLALTLCLALGACKRDLVNTTLQNPSGIPTFTASTSTIALTSTEDSTTVVNFTWTNPNYGYSAAITYTLLIDLVADTSGTAAWGNAVKVSIPTNDLSKSYLGTDFNRILNQLGLPFDAPSALVVRLEADVAQSTGAASTVPTLVKDITLSVTPYKVILIYPKLYVAGDFLTPSWTQIDQPGWILASVKSDGTYEGYLNFPNNDNNFKLCTQLSWNGTNYGWGSSGTTISGSGSAGNCYFAGPAYCRVVADTKGLTNSYTPTKWRLAGDFNGWSLSATPMTFNAATNQWTAENVSMTAGNTYKFEGDDAWVNSFGLDAKGNLAFGGGNITAAKTGTFTVTLDLSGGAGNYSYAVK
jgi:hypothetical protein